MPDNSKKIVLLLIIIVILFLYGVTKLLALRFEEGDVYPAYSSLRYDPLGTRALYEGLESILSDSIRRNYDSLGRIDTGQNSTLLYLGARKNDSVLSSEKHSKFLKRFAATGGRVVISFLPVSKTHSLKNPRKDSKADSSDAGGKPSDKSKKKTPKGESTAKAKGGKKDRAKNKGPGEKWDYDKQSQKFWGFSLEYEKNRTLFGDAEFLSGSLKDRRLPSVSWHTTLFFNNLGKGWKVIYTRNSHPVIIEKELGKGSVVLSADTYFFSNEALMKERRSELLSWIIGDGTKIIFDESHLGIQKNLGIATLGRKYNLHWLFFGLVLFGLLFVWKNSVYFVPPPEKIKDEDIYDSGPTRDYKEGLISLLRRNIRTDQILGVCVETWEKSASTYKGRLPETTKTISKIKSVIESERQMHSRQGNQVNAYQEICNILSKRKII